MTKRLIALMIAMTFAICLMLGCCVIFILRDGKDGENGKDGANGLNGTDGKDGLSWHTGAGLPAMESGAEGDYYFDLESGTVYQKTANGWDFLGKMNSPESDPETVTVRFDAGDGALGENDPSSVSLPKGSCLDLPVPTREGYRFLGWFFGDDVNGGQANDLTSFQKDMVLTARWKKILTLTLQSEEQTIELNKTAFAFTGDYDGTKDAALTLYVEKDGVRVPAKENEWVSISEVKFGTGTAIEGYLFFLQTGTYTVYVCAEENGETTEGSITVTVTDKAV